MDKRILSRLGKELLFFDGAMGSMLQKRGLGGGEIPENLNISSPGLIKDIHREYLLAGCDIITTNTFGANPLKAEFDYPLEDIIKAAVNIARLAADEVGGKERYVAFDTGPTGKLLEPLGDLSFDDAYSAFAYVCSEAEKAGADIILIETMSDTKEAKAAVLAAKENTSLPVFCTMTFDKNKKTLTGADALIMTSILEGLGADCIGVNCGYGPDVIAEIMKELQDAASIPIMAQPNAGLPAIENGQTVYMVGPDEFADGLFEIAKLGTSVLGGCCGTTPEHIRAAVKKCAGIKPSVTEKSYSVVTSYSQAVFVGDIPLIVGERINPTGKKKLKEALREGNMSYILEEATAQRDAGAHILDVNVGLPEIDEKEMMVKTITALQSVTNLPLQADSSEPPVIEAALRQYNGKALINSVNGKREVMEAVFPIVKKYGGMIIALTLDEDGIPQTAEGRLRIAEKIVQTAESYGIKRRDIVIDALTLTVSAQQKESAETIKALKMIKEKLGVKTILGVSNISFGLPCREVISSAFFALALGSGLDLCIINPLSDLMMNSYYSYCALAGYDENCEKYISVYSNTTVSSSASLVRKADETKKRKSLGNEKADRLFDIIVNGLSSLSFEQTDALLAQMQPLDIINNVLVTALDAVGAEFEKGSMFLPQLMKSAETVKNSFEAIKLYMEKSGSNRESRGRILIATVKGDIHDIGKNIVKVLLENYGYDVLDLGKDVAPEVIVDTLKRENIHLCGLSALMTTTVVSMEDTIKAIRAEGLDVRVFVGGAVLTQEYADMIGADFYAKDALASVNYANSFFTGK
ncbi:MAG: homocysteine S-methyltransferase family protein [Oscillospiraceae bacterium]|nr:homocysteine S-methyltransferase family protein [Oscillospiraceae bacterium]